MSKISRQRAKELKSMGDHDKFLKRIQKSLYYGRLPTTDRLSLPVTEYASELFSESRRASRSLDRLHSKDAAHFSREACMSPCSFVLAMLYLERLKACNPEYLQCVAPSHLFLVSLMVSSKFLYDYCEDGGVLMSEWAVSGGVAVEELIALEKEFLAAIEWNVFVNEATFWAKFTALEVALAEREGGTRGYFTYTELHALLQHIDLHALIHAITTIMAVLTATYTAGLLTIVGSIFVASQIPGHALHHQAVEHQNTTAGLQYEVYVPALQTSIVLMASDYEDIDTTTNNNNNSNREEITWDWWQSSSMTWLAHASRLMDTVRTHCTSAFDTRYSDQYFIAAAKQLASEDTMHKGTTVRMQDQLERSWHAEEWQDYLPIAYLFRDVKA